MTTLPPEPPQNPYDPAQPPYSPPYAAAEPPTQPYQQPGQPYPQQPPQPPQYPPPPGQYPPPAPPSYEPPTTVVPPQPQYGQPAQPSYEQPQYAQPQYEQPQYAQPPQPQYGQPYGQQPGYPTPPGTYPPPPGAPGAPGMPGAPVAPKKSRKGLIFGIIAIVLVVCCGGAIGGGFYLYNKVSDEVTPITDSANSFFAAVRDGGDAYSQLCTSARASISRGQFEQGLQGQPLKAFKIAAVNVVTTNGVKKATATVSLTYADRAETHVVPMANESGGWKVCGSPY